MFDVIYFPIWWYSTGLKKRVRGFVNSLRNLSHYFGLKILLAHLFKPMFGQYDWKGRIISFFMRLVQLLIYLIIFLIGTILLLALLILWIVLPLVAVWQIVSLVQ